jgi:hypothetical protein
MTGHQANLVHCYKFHILERICNTQYFTTLVWDWGRHQKARIDSWQYSTAFWYGISAKSELVI